ncbi:gluconate 2-dehydrogenase subunit 3 family protein [Pseudactinotalea sp. HY160]|uniref:gluconate 2-dehydrogenase subunit 3 family protein n=1 Tax=Pseudactinotalea sp. HY160 TaxID=2654490 RepID=UPI00128C77C2|nr:gluconate 2-dehydrogenase subunit 3 family protein [Pseudactinotalea sp. HY160]MPV49014.1 gluconate 2-dehydrogenase subunit 3 family protein [Pseudactinotalea sp. HY160]
MRDFSDPGHLPNLRPHRQPPHPDWLPRQRRGTTPQMIGRYPDYDVLDSADTWDAATRAVVLARLADPEPLRVFNEAEERTLRRFCDDVLAQDTEPRVPVAEGIDARLAAGTTEGYRYADMPGDRLAWRLLLGGLDHTARQRFDASEYARADWPCRRELLDALAAGDPDGILTGGPWGRLDVPNVWTLCMSAVLGLFYGHPWAWNEIGFGGPAYPRGYMRLGPVSVREPDEAVAATAEDPVRTSEEEGL